jgi:hypothetical protein
MRNRLKNPGTERPESSTSAQKTKMVQVAMAADSQLLEGRNGHHFESFFFFFESFCLADFPFAAIPRPSFSRILSSCAFREGFGSRLLNTYFSTYLFLVMYVPWYLAASTLIILFLEMLKFSNSFFSQRKKIGKKNIGSSRIFYLSISKFQK